MAPVSVAVPLYIYPEVRNWDPLFQVIEKHPHAHFNVVINPYNGPGGLVPDSNYVKEVARLNSYRNVAVFGYVHVSWANRSIDLVIDDIKVWSRWRDYDKADIHADGIFVDEAPANVAEVSYMAQIYKATKRSLGENAAVWTNPGVDINPAFYQYADLVNAHENSHAAWLKQEHQHVDHKATTMIHSYGGSRQDLVADISALRRAGYNSVLITTETCYTTFSQYFDELVQQLSV